MKNAIVYNLVGETPGLSIFFAFWPYVTTLVFMIFGESHDGRPHRLGKVLYYSWATYLGVGNPEEINREHFRKLKFFHQLLGRFAWAYIIAIFVVTIG